MQFISQLPPEFTMIHSRNFLEGSNTVMYCLGISEGNPAIIKIDTKGAIVWSKSYDLNLGGALFDVHSITQIQENQYVFCVQAATGNTIFKITDGGTFVFAKEMEGVIPAGNAFLVNDAELENFNLVFLGAERAGDKKRLYLYKLAHDGTVIKAKRSTDTMFDNMEMITVKSFFGGIAIVALTQNAYTEILDVDYDLEFSYWKHIEPKEFSFVPQDLNVHASDSGHHVYQVSGKIDDGSGFLLIRTNNEVIRYKFEEGNIMSTALCQNGTTIFLSTYDTENVSGIIHRFKFLKELQAVQYIWSKVCNTREQQLPFDQMSFSPGNSLLCHSTQQNILVLTNQNLDSCATEETTAIFSQYKTPAINNVFRIEEIEKTKIRDRDVRENDPRIDNTLICTVPSPEIIINDRTTTLQSSAILIEAVGSDGSDGSAVGNHIRWSFGKLLKEYHLPKGNFSSNEYNYNKPNDFVHLYRIPYSGDISSFTLSLIDVPTIVNDTLFKWTYIYGNHVFHVVFKDHQKYQLALDSISATEDPDEFLSIYGNGLIEVTSENNLFFTAVLLAGGATDTVVQTEILSVPDTSEPNTLALFSRRTTQFADNTDLTFHAVNGKTIRYTMNHGIVLRIVFQFYDVFLGDAIASGSLEFMGDFALTTDDDVALSSLEPTPGLVHGKWKRFNNYDFVNIDGYTRKWNAENNSSGNLKSLVTDFLNLSEDQNNPTGLVFSPQSQQDEEQEVPTPDEMIPLLTLLNMSATDFHYARMLGLGTLDLYNATVNNQFVYVAVYETERNASNPSQQVSQQHISMSLPTSPFTQRLCEPVDIDTILPGVFDASGAPDFGVADVNGYSDDGKTRYISIYNKALFSYQLNPTFYQNYVNFDRSKFTPALYGGLDYNLTGSSTNWVRPELSHDIEYLNAVNPGDTPTAETVPLLLEDEMRLLYMVEQTKSGDYYYHSYGINIFSRATGSNIYPDAVHTEIKPKNQLRPPTNIAANLIQYENPVLMTSLDEQNLLTQISGDDKTLVRLTYDFHSVQDSYIEKILEEDNTKTNQEIVDDLSLYSSEFDIFPDEVQILYKNRIPNVVSGKITDVNTADTAVSVLTTASYTFASQFPQSISPTITPGEENNYLGGLLSIGEQVFKIKAITIVGGFPKITVYNNIVTQTIGESEDNFDESNIYVAPILTNDGFFTIVENLQNVSSWGTPIHPNPLAVKIGHNSWTVHREIFESVDYDGNPERFIERARGFWKNGTIVKVNETVQTFDADGNPNLIEGEPVTVSQHIGLYKFTFTDFQLPAHEQQASKVTFQKGILRLKTQGALTHNGERRICQIVEYDTTASNLIVYFRDEQFDPALDADYIIQAGQQLANFYPGYRIHLFKDQYSGLIDTNILPQGDETERYSILGLRAHSINNYEPGGYYSIFGNPGLIYAPKLIKALPPLPPEGAFYATRPDFYGKATYTFKTTFSHEPHAAIFYRASDELLLNAIYKPETVAAIRTNLATVGGNDEDYVKARWTNFLYPALLDASFGTWNSYSFPMPDNQEFIDGINSFISWHNENNSVFPPAPAITAQSIVDLQSIMLDVQYGVQTPLRVIDFMVDSLHNSFQPLTEMPLIYKYIKSVPHQPVSTKQNLRNRDGNLLAVTDPDFLMAPMAVRSTGNVVSFTDFTLDGTSKNLYFYAVKEMGSKLDIGTMSTAIGPVKMINSNPPLAPEVVKLLQVVPNEILGINGGVEIEVNTYRAEQHIVKLNLYRTYDRNAAESVRDMVLVNSIDVMSGEGLTWKIGDDFAGSGPKYSTPIYYRIVALRKIEYSEYNAAGEALTAIPDLVPSYPSKILGIVLTDSTPPESPQLAASYSSLTGLSLTDVVLQWDNVLTAGYYHLYKMSSQGNWIEIKKITLPADSISLADTSLASSSLQVITEQGVAVYHHFKMISENASGLLSKEEKIITVTVPGLEDPDLGIGEMIIGPTFILS